MMRALLVVIVLVCSGGTALAQGTSAPLGIALPQSPPVANQTSRLLFDAMLAISRAQQNSPGAATAAFDYTKAVQQYRSGDLVGARASALQALSNAARPAAATAVAAPLPTPALAAAPASIPGLGGGLYGADAPAIDADSFLALARGLLDACAARHAPTLPRARERYAAAERDFAARNYQATRLNAKAAIDACAQPH